MPNGDFPSPKAFRFLLLTGACPTLLPIVQRLPLFIVLLMSCFVGRAETVLIPKGSLWKYLLIEPPPAWNQPAFNDFSWTIDEAQLGYGDFDESTLLPANGETVCFRRQFNLAVPAGITSLTLRMVADDGAIVYLNGHEVVRYNLPAGTVTHATTTLLNVEAGENDFRQFGINPILLRSNLNVLAVELHQHTAGRGDASFDLELIANRPAGPPHVEITFPTNGTILPVTTVPIRVAVRDPIGHIRAVQIFTNGAIAAQSTVEPFEFLWLPPAPGGYTIEARAFNHLYEYADSAPVRFSHGVPGSDRLKHEPYLQSCTTTGITVRWNTDWFTSGVLRYGTEPEYLDRSLTNIVPSTVHEFRVPGLTPGTTYYYSAGTAVGSLASGSQYRFRTAPTNSEPVRIWVVGDSGSGDADAEAVRDGYYLATGERRTDMMLMLGDNSYANGLMDNYERDVFRMYGSLLRQTPVWPTMGNHDAGDSQPPFMSAYLQSFVLPTQGEAGGTPSGTELYYSFDHANIHFVCLDSYVSGRQPADPMLRWLEDDLANTTRDWIIAYWHHPPYSKGSHDSDNDSWQTEMRQFVLPVLEAYGVDLVLSGHSHSYERSFLINGHYGFSGTLLPEMIRSQEAGNPLASGPYRKPSGGLGANAGTVYAVCGCSGAGGTGDDFPRHPVMATNLGGFGSMILEIDDLKLTGKFLRPSGAIDDLFAIDKSTTLTNSPAISVRRESGGPLFSWPTSRPGFALEQSHDPGSQERLPFLGVSWTQGRRHYARPETNAPLQFFRLRSESVR